MGHLKYQLAKEGVAQSVRAEFTALEKEFQSLLRMPQVKSAIMENKKPFYKLIASHGDEVSTSGTFRERTQSNVRSYWDWKRHSYLKVKTSFRSSVATPPGILKDDGRFRSRGTTAHSAQKIRGGSASSLVAKVLDMLHERYIMLSPQRLSGCGEPEED